MMTTERVKAEDLVSKIYSHLTFDSTTHKDFINPFEKTLASLRLQLEAIKLAKIWCDELIAASPQDKRDFFFDVMVELNTMYGSTLMQMDAFKTAAVQ